jgi:hypothetical protein
MKKKRRGPLFIGEGAVAQRGGRPLQGVPPPLPSSCEWSPHSYFKIPLKPFLIPTQKFQEFLFNKTILFTLIFVNSIN